MFEMLKKLYQEGRTTIFTLENAVVKGFITQSQADEIKMEEQNGENN